MRNRRSGRFPFGPRVSAMALLLTALLAVPAACADLGAARGTAVPGPVPMPAGAHEDDPQAWWIPVEPNPAHGPTYLLDSMVYRPSGKGPFALVVINHGLPSDHSELRAMRPSYRAAARWWVAHGYVAVVPLRRGVGASQGDFVERTEHCDSEGYARRAEVASSDIKGVVRYFSAQSFIDADRIIVVGQSAGGFASLGLAMDPPVGVRAVVDFAGGAGGDGTGHICGGATALIGAMAQLGKRAKLPELWLFSENDKWFGAIARPMYGAYRANAAVPVDFISLPPLGEDGHATLSRADPGVWGPSVEAFLARLPPAKTRQ